MVKGDERMCNRKGFRGLWEGGVAEWLKATKYKDGESKNPDFLGFSTLEGAVQ